MPVEIIARWAVPVFVGCILLVGLIRRVPVFDEFTAGAAEGPACAQAFFLLLT